MYNFTFGKKFIARSQTNTTNITTQQTLQKLQKGNSEVLAISEKLAHLAALSLNTANMDPRITFTFQPVNTYKLECSMNYMKTTSS